MAPDNKWSLAWRKGTPYWQAADEERWERVRRSLAHMRQSLNMSLQDVEDATGIRRTHVHQFEIGKVTEPKVAFIFALGQLYGLTPNDIAAQLGLDVGTQDVPSDPDMDARVVALVRRLRDLPPDLADRALDMMYSTVATFQKLARDEELPGSR